MADKRMTEADVVGRLRSGMTIGIGGWGSRRKPMSLVRAIVRSDLTDLTVVSYGGPDVGLLCAASKIKKLVRAEPGRRRRPGQGRVRRGLQAISRRARTMTEAPEAPEAEPVVLYRTDGPIAVITMNRPEYRNAQNSAMTYALDSAYYRAAADDDVKVLVLAGRGKHFSAGHDIGTPGRDVGESFHRKAGLWWDHVGKQGAESRYAREAEVYVGMCRRWRELPKPTIAMVHGACIAGALMLAWSCDLIVASDDAFFADPVVKMGIPGVEYFCHPFVLGPRIAKEFLFTGDRISAQRAYELAMVNRVVPRDQLEPETMALAARIAQMPRLGLALTKKAVNQVEDIMGLQTGIDSVFGLHHLAHAHNAEVEGDSLGGQTINSLKRS